VIGQRDARPIALIISEYCDLARDCGLRLGREGYTVRLSTNPMQALVSLEASPPSMILLARKILPTGGLMFLRVLRAHTAVKTVPTIGIGSPEGIPAAILGEARELGLLDRSPSVGQTWSIDRHGGSRTFAPDVTLADTGTKVPVLGPIAIVQTRDGSIPLSIQTASTHRMQVMCGRDQLTRGDTLRLTVREKIAQEDTMREVNLRILAEVSAVTSLSDGVLCTLQIEAANPPEEYAQFVRYLGER